ncbi:hypothetical protein HispidOSU_029121 [Sigmodon hispidus]
MGKAAPAKLLRNTSHEGGCPKTKGENVANSPAGLSYQTASAPSRHAPEKPGSPAAHALHRPHLTLLLKDAVTSAWETDSRCLIRRGAVQRVPLPNWSAPLSAGLALFASANKVPHSLESGLAGVVAQLFPRINNHLEEERTSGTKIQFKPVVADWKMKMWSPHWWFICSSCNSSVLKERGNCADQ